MPSRPCIFVTCGLPFSGKSTLARALAKRLGCPLIVLDDINAERGLDGGRGIAPAEWERTSHIALQRVSDQMGAGGSSSMTRPAFDSSEIGTATWPNRTGAICCSFSSKRPSRPFGGG